MYKRNLISIILLCLFIPIMLKAEEIIINNELPSSNETENKILLDEITITARGYDSPVSKTPGGVGIIKSEDILNLQPNSITDALRTVPGVNKSSDSAWGSEVSIRGSSRSNTVFLIDGIRLNTSTDIGAQFGTIDPMAVKRVEILKGPISSLYGSGTIGGVVNVITKNGWFADSATLNGGTNVSYNFNSSGINTYAFSSYNAPQYYIFTSGSYRDHNSYEDGSGNEMRNSQFTDMQGNINLGFKLNKLHTLELKSQYFKGKDIGIPGAGDVGLPSEADVTYKSVERTLLNLNYTYNPDSKIFKKSRLSLSYHTIERDVIVNNLPLPAGSFMDKLEPKVSYRTFGIYWINNLNLENHDIVCGMDSWIRTITDKRTRTKLNGETSVDTPLPDSWYLSTGVFTEDDWKMTKLFKLNLGGRFDRIQVHNDETYLYETTFATAPPAPAENRIIWEEYNTTEYSWNAHAGLTYSITDLWSTSLLAARGYRAASLEERYKYINLGSGVEKWGNPDLKPEESLFFEYGLNRHERSLGLGGSVYYNKLDYLISEEQVSSTRTELQNIDKAEIYGVEFEFSVHPLQQLTINGNAAYTRGRDTKNDTDLSGIPPFNGFLRIHYTIFSGLWTQIDAIYNASQKHVPSGTEESRDWTRFDIMAGYKFTSCNISHEIYGAIDNLLNEKYSDYLTTSRGYTFNEPGRTYRVGYKMEF